MFRELNTNEIEHVAGGFNVPNELGTGFDWDSFGGFGVDSSVGFDVGLMLRDWWQDDFQDVNGNHFRDMFDQPWLLDGKNDKAANTCPTGNTCVPAGDVKGHFVRDVSDGKLYLSDKGWDFYKNGPTVDWVGVAKDLAAITSGAIGGAGGGAAAVSGMLGLVAWGIDYFRGQGN